MRRITACTEILSPTGCEPADSRTVLPDGTTAAVIGAPPDGPVPRIMRADVADFVLINTELTDAQGPPNAEARGNLRRGGVRTSIKLLATFSKRHRIYWSLADRDVRTNEMNAKKSSDERI